MSGNALSPGLPTGAVLWLTGLSSAGKTTLGRELATRLRAGGHRVELLDGDEMRQHLCRDLGFSRQDRDEHVRRLAYVAGLLARNGVVAVVCAISPYRAAREAARQQAERFFEVFVNAPLEVCETRDVKGLYRKARAGLIQGFTGLDDPYEAPLQPDLECRTDQEDLEACARRVLDCVCPILG
ncbi:MAG: adenylyl-sulfate kinase [Geothrix sp.]|uniref:adenylyl-sulfate kinase n=1 Tax=Geothrix sp. TaxID=1962974 RepID=UPI00184DA619|nr:adenylyl-sulfate kinase [Geothrix sp.]NWJ41931.1 adenylyl-sulfate kinase [Geothrix sp.]WIL20096.1 MAG: adenylyl-sulfate kinase [Geothrix sp.]